MIVFSHATGNQNVRNALRALEEAEALERFCTTVAAFEGNVWGRVAKFPGASVFARRSYDKSLRVRTCQFPARELGRMVFSRLGLSAFTLHESGPCCIDEVYHDLDRHVALMLRKGKFSSAKAVYAYEDGALESFRAAEERGLNRLYDLPIGYWRAGQRIQSEEAERRPEWASTMPALIDSEEKLARKDEELRLADQILVASSFTAQTLQEAPFEFPKPVVIPYGCPPVSFSEPQKAREMVKEKLPLKVLFVGGLSQRKGLSYLFEAVEQLGSAVELTVVGRKPSKECRALEEGLEHCRYIPSLPHECILSEMDRQDVFVFPSLFEGFGLVITESLSRGLPVITTTHTCGPDVLSEGKDGFLVPIRSAEAIAEKLTLLHQDRTLLATMKEAAIAKAHQLTWEDYRAGVVAAVKGS